MDERMKKTDERYEAYLNILKKELVPAFGCTEPIAVAYAAACLRVLLGGEPETLRVEASGNIIKNVKSVIVPNTGGMKGIEAAAAAGIISGREDRQLEVLEELTEEDQKAIHTYLERMPVAVTQAPGDLTFDLIVTGERDGHKGKVRIAGAHTNVVLKELDGKILLKKRDRQLLFSGNAECGGGRAFSDHRRNRGLCRFGGNGGCEGNAGSSDRL